MPQPRLQPPAAPAGKPVLISAVLASGPASIWFSTLGSIAPDVCVVLRGSELGFPLGVR